MRKIVLLASVTAALLALGTSPAMALGAPQRPAGSVVTGLVSDNGGDNGWGNCGHNSSGGTDAARLGTAGQGNGGYKPWDLCPTPTATPAVDDAATPTDNGLTQVGTFYS